MIFVEMHVVPHDAAKVLGWLASRGWAATLASGKQSQTARGRGCSGGVLIAWRSQLQLAPGKACGATPFGTTTGYGWALAVFSTRGILFGVGAAYFTHGVGCKGENGRKFHEPAQAIRGSGCQGYLICGVGTSTPRASEPTG